MKREVSPFIHLRVKPGLSVFGLVLATLAVHVARGTPYASGLTNNGGGAMSFYLNEGGGNVTITYEDGSTNANYDGARTGTNLASGRYTFSLGAHTGYAISVYKAAAGVPTLITNSLSFTPSGIDVNRHPASPYFGRVYASSLGSGIYAMNSDLSLVYANAQTAGQTWVSGNRYSPYRLYVADDDYLMIGDASSANAGIYRADPNLATSQLFLGPSGEAVGLADGVFGTVESRPLLIGNLANGPVTLMEVDRDFSAASGYNSLLVYTNLTADSLPWEYPPDIQGPEIGPNLTSEALGGNEHPGLQVGPSGYIYAGAYPKNYSNPLLQIYSYDPSLGFYQLWNSYYNAGTADYFRTTVNGLTCGIVDIAVSPDGRYVAGVSLDNWLVIAPLTNGIPDVSNLFVTTPTSTAGIASGIAFDAADNLYLSSSGIGLVQSWSLGISAIAMTSGNASGATDFHLVFPATSVPAVAITAISDTFNQGVNHVTIQFTSTDSSDTAALFVLQSANNPAGPYANASAAMITLVSTANNQSLFQATINPASSSQFYRLRYR
jgi:hypothetical protein